MACRMIELLTILATLAGLAFGQEPTLAGTSPSVRIGMTTTRTDPTGATSTSRLTTTATSSIIAYAESTKSHCHSSGSSSDSSSGGSSHSHSNKNNSTVTAAPKTTTVPHAPWTPTPVPNAGRRPTQPGLRKLTIVVGLATYGLILL
ncbi:hypothetical protein E4U21_000212 [Claviceps maximensis]|nr:hypothetical protein E4U21_000212 [Claviceps maximensis]